MNDDDWDGEKEGWVLGREDGWGEERKENWEGERGNDRWEEEEEIDGKGRGRIGEYSIR